jgi:putative FmdB family regulatory protein
MPIYEYRCESCGHTLDALQKISDDPLRECPSCGESSLKRLISAPAFRLKGSGWYETDFKSDKEKKRNLAESASAESKDKAKGDSGTESASAESKKGGDKPKSGGDKPKPSGDKPKPAKGKGNEAA